MFESFLAKYGYVAILLGSAFEGETIMIMGGFSAHRGYLKLLPWVILAGFVGNFTQSNKSNLLALKFDFCAFCAFLRLYQNS
jgi:membrane protein DedA with SNARE-associated domain